VECRAQSQWQDPTLDKRLDWTIEQILMSRGKAKNKHCLPAFGRDWWRSATIFHYRLTQQKQQ
jgi:hypothetical protein